MFNPSSINQEKEYKTFLSKQSKISKKAGYIPERRLSAIEEGRKSEVERTANRQRIAVLQRVRQQKKIEQAKREREIEAKKEALRLEAVRLAQLRKNQLNKNRAL
jgi:hypothetical protein